MTFRLLVFFVLLNSLLVFSQKKTTKHVVKEGETLSEIADKYNVTLKEICSLNPKSKHLLALKAVVLIPNKTISKTKKVSSKNENYNEISHEVMSKETLYGIAKKYGISLEIVQTANPELGDKPLIIGQKIRIPKLKESQEITVKGVSILKNEKKGTAKPGVVLIPTLECIVREVLPKETKYSIAKQYGISIQELEKQNPEIVNKLPVGFKLGIEVLISNTFNKENPVVAIAIQESKNHSSSYSNKDNIVLQLIQKASECLGIKYHSGGSTNAGFDCSGLMYATFKLFDIELPRSSFEQATLGTKINVSEAKKGDLIFFKTNGRKQINHVGLITDIIDNEIKFIHSSLQSGVVISSIKEKYYEKTFSQINRIFK